jgi:hypothetical protein
VRRRRWGSAAAAIGVHRRACRVYRATGP